MDDRSSRCRMCGQPVPLFPEPMRASYPSTYRPDWTVGPLCGQSCLEAWHRLGPEDKLLIGMSADEVDRDRLRSLRHAVAAGYYSEGTPDGQSFASYCVEKGLER